ncbi:cob(I)yrinic acid a,c-diamide adenosyltransferase [Candidatus Fermentibacterales bacterium]|nr:cob(I)yrinic acid a,c-diamide adenosyltransferase [Candidatus Fermentibacterales bacterium]
MSKRARVHVYTGDGKGKTTAALGLAVRAACAGLRVYFGQMMKGPGSSEQRLAELCPGLLLMEHFGTGRLLGPGEGPSEEDRARAARGLSRLREAATSGEYDVVVGDEVCVAVYMGFLDEADVLALIDERRPDVELVITGRNATARIMDAADLVTEMREVRHYYATEGLEARRGIEL